MKSVLGVILIGLFIFGHVEVWGADWKHLGSNSYGIFYYDSESITYPTKNIVRVWEKIEFSERGVSDFVVKTFGKRFESVSYIKALSEINCVEKMTRTLSTTYFSKEEDVLWMTKDYQDITSWRFISPESFGETLYKAICK